MTFGGSVPKRRVADAALIAGFILISATILWHAFGKQSLVVVPALGAVLCAVTLGFLRPKLSPFILIFFVVFDRLITVTSEIQINVSTLVLALLAPGFVYEALKIRARARVATIGSALLASGLLISCLAAAEQQIAVLGAVRWWLVLIMIAGMAAMMTRHPALLHKVGLGILAGGVVSAVFGVLQMTGRYFLVGPPYADDVFDSTFGYYTNFANFQAVASVIGIGVVIHRFRTARKLPLLLIAGTLLCLYMVVVSMSRGAVVFVAVGLVIILLKNAARPGRLLAGLTGIGVAVLSVIQVAPAKYVDAIVGKFMVAPGGDIVREQLQAGGTQLLSATPQGIGFGNFRQLVESGSVVSRQALAHSHNTWIQMGLDAGWMGLVGFAILTVYAVWCAYRSNGSAVRIAFGAALAAYMVQISQDFFFFENASLVVFGMLIAGALSAPSHVVGTVRPDEAGGANGDRMVGPQRYKVLENSVL